MKRQQDELSDYDSGSDDSPPEVFSSSAGAGPSAEADWQGNERDWQGRANKNRPAQASTKRRVSTFRVAPGLKPMSHSSLAPTHRDPRFDAHDSNTNFNEEGWRKSYAFLFEKQKEEAAEMKARLEESQKASKRAKQRGGGAKRQRTREKVLSADEEQSMRLELERTRNRLAVDEKKGKQQAVKVAVRREEVEAVKQGKKPFFQKASVLREKELVLQYEELKKTGKLDKFLQRRRKKVEGKQKREMPNRPGGAWGGGSW